ncbi:MAG: hypothetical protein GY938_31605 [Ketobacter sp.]|nr:hypothetical protein [Ketobacter sp.]
MAYPNDTRCETLTSRGKRCKNTALHYRKHGDGVIYHVCKTHLQDRWFQPYRKEG